MNLRHLPIYFLKENYHNWNALRTVSYLKLSAFPFTVSISQVQSPKTTQLLTKLGRYSSTRSLQHFSTRATNEAVSQKALLLCGAHGCCSHGYDLSLILHDSSICFMSILSFLIHLAICVYMTYAYIFLHHISLHQYIVKISII